MTAITSIQITFGAPIALTNEEESAIQFVVNKICGRYSKENPDRVMWLAGYGGLPMNTWDDENLDFDMTVLSMDCAERENYESEPTP